MRGRHLPRRRTAGTRAWWTTSSVPLLMPEYRVRTSAHRARGRAGPRAGARPVQGRWSSMRLRACCWSEVVILLMNLVPAACRRRKSPACPAACTSSARGRPVRGPPFCGWAPCSGTLFRLVTCPSGRRCNTRNVVWCKSQRGFKSHRHRQIARPLLPFVEGSRGLLLCPRNSPRSNAAVTEISRGAVRSVRCWC